MKEDLLMMVAALGLTCALLLLRHLFLRGGYNKGAVVKLTKFIDRHGDSGTGDGDEEWPLVIVPQADASPRAAEGSDAEPVEFGHASVQDQKMSREV